MPEPTVTVRMEENVQDRGGLWADRMLPVIALGDVSNLKGDYG